VPVDIPLTKISGDPTVIKTGIRISGGNTKDALVPVAGTTGTGILLEVVPKLTAAVSVPVLTTATIKARVGELGTSCKPVAVAEVVKSRAKVLLNNFKEAMIVLLGKY
jgi:hypothetical protein